VHALCFLLSTAVSVEWIHEGPRTTFQISSPDRLSTSGAGNSPNWVHTAQEYENFRLSFEYKLAQWAEAAVYLRAPRSERPAQGGLAIVLAHDFHKQLSKHVTGAIAGVLPPRSQQAVSFDVWHRAMVLLEGDRLRVEIDGVEVQDVDLTSHDELKYRLRRGLIGFPDLGHAYEIRKIAIEDLGSPTRFVALDGWKLRGAGNWSFADGVVRGANGHGVLYAQQRFRDFEFTAIVRSHHRVNAGVFFRGSPDEAKSRGFEVQIYSPVEAVYPTGSIYSIQRSTSRVEFEERWFLMQVRVEGARCRVWLDGELVSETQQLPILDEGQIGLQIHMDNASVEFRDLRVRILGR
jgi:hypothetical protein